MQCCVCPVYGRTGEKREDGSTKPKPRLAEAGWFTCSTCRDRISNDVKSIPELFGLLDATPGSAGGSGRVSGSREAPLGVRVAVLDLITTTPLGTVTDPYRDQTGHVPVTVVLATWAEDWRDQAHGDHPPSTVPELCGWLADRVDWACREHPAIDAFASDIRGVLGVLYATTGHAKGRPEHKRGVPCPKCDRMVLYRAAGDDWVECMPQHKGCGHLMSPHEYERWVRLVASGVAA